MRTGHFFGISCSLFGIGNAMKSVKYYAAIHDVSARRIRMLCEKGRVVGAEKIGKTWILPDIAVILRAKRTGARVKIAFV